MARKGLGQKIPMKGVWRFWFEGAGAGDIVQRASLATADSSNPRHLFEIHPVTFIGGVSVLDSLKPIPGFKAKSAEIAFNRYEAIQCKIESMADKTKISSVLAGYNYVEFILEANETPKKVDDGWLVDAKVLALGAEVLSVSVRMVIVKDSPPATKLAKLAKGERARVLGMPRINLSLIHARIIEAKTEPLALVRNLPYEYRQNGKVLSLELADDGVGMATIHTMFPQEKVPQVCLLPWRGTQLSPGIMVLYEQVCRTISRPCNACFCPPGASAQARRAALLSLVYDTYCALLGVNLC